MKHLREFTCSHSSRLMFVVLWNVPTAHGIQHEVNMLIVASIQVCREQTSKHIRPYCTQAKASPS